MGVALVFGGIGAEGIMNRREKAAKAAAKKNAKLGNGSVEKKIPVKEL